MASHEPEWPSKVVRVICYRINDLTAVHVAVRELKKPVA